MKCYWDSLIKILPVHIRKHMDKFSDNGIEEIHLRLNMPPAIYANNTEYYLNERITAGDLSFCINIASQYSPWSVETIPQGYITIEGGHRIGLSGNVIYKGNAAFNINSIYSVCIRVAQEFPGISQKLWQVKGSVLIIGQPGSGKTTLLRDLICQKSNNQKGTVCIVDEKMEIFPFHSGKPCFDVGKRSDIISGCKKRDGINIALRNLGPSIIAVDEITALEDSQALLHAGWCGVDLIASAHAGCRQDLFARPIYKPILESKLFDTLIILDTNKTWHAERMYT